MRYLPREENAQAANEVWASFCREHDGGEGNGQRVNVNRKPWTGFKGKAEGEVPLERELLDLRGKSKVESDDKGKTTTYTTTWNDVPFTRAVFEIDFDFKGSEEPTEKNDWLLPKNPCWPKDLIPNDPGYVLLTEDNWYQTHKFPNGFNKQQTLASCSKAPPEEWVQEAEQRGAQVPAKRPHPPRHLAERAEPGMKLEYVEDTLVLRDDARNTSRRLTKEELDDRVEVIRCASRRCEREREEFHEEDGFVYVPRNGPPSRPAGNLAVPTQASTFATSLVEVSSEKSAAALDRPRETGM